MFSGTVLTLNSNAESRIFMVINITQPCVWCLNNFSVNYLDCISETLLAYMQCLRIVNNFKVLTFSYQQCDYKCLTFMRLH